jgi:hypothetical protein
LLDRRNERAVFDGLIDGARAGRSGVLVVRGEAGVGKTALLEYAIESTSDLEVMRAVGVESEMELAFAALHQLCTPIVDRLERLPGPQRDALQVTFGLREGAAPDRFLVGLAVLGLLSDAAEEHLLPRLPLRRTGCWRSESGCGSGIRWCGSAVYSSASLPRRQAAHRALAEVTDAGRDPDRRAWHLAAAAPGPDEEAAAALERSAGRAQARGGMAAAAAFLQRAAELTAEPGQRSERALAAGQASLQAGGLEAAAELLAMAMAGPLDELQQARAGLLRGQIAFASGGGSDAPALLARAAKQLEPLDAALARQTYLDAWVAARFAGRFAGAGDLHVVSRAARSAPPPAGVPQPSDLLLDGLAMLVTEGRAEAAPCCGGQRGSSPRTRSPSKRACDGASWLSSPPGSCGTRNAGTRSRPASSSSAARWACSPRW